MRVKQAFIHVDVDNLRAVFNLLPRDLDGAGIVIGHDQLLERSRASDVGTLTDVDEIGGGLLGHIYFHLFLTKPLPFRGGVGVGRLGGLSPNN